jgi:hypothetical protein
MKLFRSDSSNGCMAEVVRENGEQRHTDFVAPVAVINPLDHVDRLYRLHIQPCTRCLRLLVQPFC